MQCTVEGKVLEKSTGRMGVEGIGHGARDKNRVAEYPFGAGRRFVGSASSAAAR